MQVGNTYNDCLKCSWDSVIASGLAGAFQGNNNVRLCEATDFFM